MKKFTLLSLLFLTFFACRNDIDETLSTVVEEDPITTTLIDYNPIVDPVTATLFGIVNDESGAPVSGATVKLDDNTYTTDDSGRFVFNNITMNADGTFVRITSAGYFPGSHRFFPREGSVNYATITMMVKENTGNFVSTQGGVVTGAQGIQVEFPANSVVTSNGTTYEGTVEVAARWIDPTADNLLDIMPGNLQGVRVVDGDYEEVALASFGMMAVELESTDGAALNLGNNLNATLTFPVPDELLGNAPSEIPLWSFNETHGIWVEEGSATLQGDNYVGEVSHFSFWNCDYPYPLIDLSGTVVSADGAPVPWASVTLTMTNGGVGYAYTNTDGEFGGKVPKDETFTMEIYQYNACGELYTEEIGPFAVDTDLGDIVIEATDLLEISGTVENCAMEAVTNGWVDITLGSNTYSVYVDDGTFSTALYNCDNETEVTILAGDLDAFVIGTAMTYTIVDPLNVGAVATCGTVLPEFFEITIDGITTSFPNPYLFMNPGPDSTEIGSGNLPGTDYYMNINMDEITGPGTYNNDDVGNAGFFLPGSTNGAIWMNCYNGSGQQECGFTEIVVDVFPTNIGDDMEGTFAGVAEVFDSLQGTLTLPYTGAFKITRD